MFWYVQAIGYCMVHDAQRATRKQESSKSQAQECCLPVLLQYPSVHELSPGLCEQMVHASAVKRQASSCCHILVSVQIPELSHNCLACHKAHFAGDVCIDNIAASSVNVSLDPGCLTCLDVDCNDSKAQNLHDGSCTLHSLRCCASVLQPFAVRSAVNA